MHGWLSNAVRQHIYNRSVVQSARFQESLLVFSAIGLRRPHIFFELTPQLEIHGSLRFQRPSIELPAGSVSTEFRLPDALPIFAITKFFFEPPTPFSTGSAALVIGLTALVSNSLHVPLSVELDRAAVDLTSFKAIRADSSASHSPKLSTSSLSLSLLTHILTVVCRHIDITLAAARLAQDFFLAIAMLAQDFLLWLPFFAFFF